MIQEAIDFGLRKLGYQSLREGQQKVIDAYIRGNDVFFCSPTGSGKSLCFEIAPFVYDCVKLGVSVAEDQPFTTSVCIIVAPLVSLMKDQVSSMRKKGISAVCIGEDTTTEDLEDVKKGKFNLVFGSPEALLNKYRCIFRGELRKYLRAVFVDESHCIAKWGRGKGTEEAFRSDYSRLGELRSLMRKDVPFITLTATSTNTTKKIIIKDLCMKDCVEVVANPNRPSTRYAVVDVDVKDLYSTFSWLIDSLENLNVATPKVIIFCRKKEHMKELFELFSLSLGDKSYHRPTGKEPKDDRTRLFGMYHKMTHHLVKQTIEEEFCKPNGSVRVLFCSIAFGMGVNVKDIHLNLHLGPSGDLDDYLQESGRVGRDSSKISHAVLLKYKGCTASKNITKAMKEYVKNTSLCRRDLLLRYFGCSVPNERTLHECCDICARDCTCLCKCKAECTCITKCLPDLPISEMEKHLKKAESGAQHPKQKVNNISRSGAVKLRGHLLSYRSELARKVLNENQPTEHCNFLTGIDATTGYSRRLIDDVVKNINFIKDKSYIEENFQFYSEDHVQRTWELVSLALAESIDTAPDNDSDGADNVTVSDNASTDDSKGFDSDDSSSSYDSTSSEVYFKTKQRFHAVLVSEPECSSDSDD